MLKELQLKEIRPDGKCVASFNNKDYKGDILHKGTSLLTFDNILAKIASTFGKGVGKSSVVRQTKLSKLVVTATFWPIYSFAKIFIHPALLPNFIAELSSCSYTVCNAAHEFQVAR